VAPKYLVFLLSVSVIGCSESDSNIDRVNTQKSVYDFQVQTIEKAKATNKLIQDAAVKQRKAIEEQGS
jgi:hypothetical protein